MLVVEAKLKNGTPEQYHRLDEAIITSQFVRNSCVRYWMDHKGTTRNDLLDLTRLETGQLKLTLSRVKIDRLCQRVYDIMSQISQLICHARDDSDEEVQETARWAIRQLNLQLPPSLGHLGIQLIRLQFRQFQYETLEPVQQSLKDSELQPSDINRVILVGGSTRIPPYSN